MSNDTEIDTNALKIGDVITFDIPRPPWWRLIALYKYYARPRHYIVTGCMTSSRRTDLPDNYPQLTNS